MPGQRKNLGVMQGGSLFPIVFTVIDFALVLLHVAAIISHFPLTLPVCFRRTCTIR